MILFKKKEIDNYPMLSPENKILAKLNDEKEKELGTTYLWDWQGVAGYIMANMKREAGKDPRYDMQQAYFVALRLKFADEKTINLMKDAIFNHKKHYTETINGEHTIFETMQRGNLDYFMALCRQYLQTEEGEDSKLPSRTKGPDCRRTLPARKTEFSELSEDGTYIIYLTKDEYHEKYGLSEIEKMNRPMTEEEKIKFEERTKILDAEIEKYEKIFKRDARKWTKEQNEKFQIHLKQIYKEKGL